MPEPRPSPRRHDSELCSAEAATQPALPLGLALAVVCAGFLVVSAALVIRKQPASTTAPIASPLATPPRLATAPIFDPIVPDAPAPAAEPAAALDFQQALHAGDASFDAADFALAARHYGAALQLDPNQAAAWVGRGNARARLGDHAGALVDLQRALELTGLDDPRRPLVERDFDRLQHELELRQTDG